MRAKATWWLNDTQFPFRSGHSQSDDCPYHRQVNLTRTQRPGLGAVTLAAGVTVSGSLPVFLTGGLAVQVRDDLGFSAALFGFVIAIYFGVSATTSAYMGYSAQRFGLNRSVRIASTGSALAMLLAAVAPNYAVLAAAMAVAGLANALPNQLQTASSYVMSQRVGAGFPSA